MNALRNNLRHQRRSIPPAQRERYAKKILSKAQRIAHFKRGQKIALYLPNDGEIDTKYLINFLKIEGVGIYLPILSGGKLKFAKLGNTFKRNRFGINEPCSTPIVNARQLNIIFMPLVGFDKHKHRLGMGGGFYDRTLAFKQRQQHYQSPKLYGLAFDCQQIGHLESEPWDIPLDAVITPNKIYK